MASPSLPSPFVTMTTRVQIKRGNVHANRWRMAGLPCASGRGRAADHISRTEEGRKRGKAKSEIETCSFSLSLSSETD